MGTLLMTLFLFNAFVFLATVILFIWVNEKFFDLLQRILATSAILCLFFGLTLLFAVI